MNATFSSNPLAPLQKGKACTHCRRRKTKCDAARPICGPCSKFSSILGDCEFPEDGPSRRELLEDQISILQARIDELEKNKERAVPSTSGSRTATLSPPQIGLAHNFLHNASYFGFFLHSQVFHDAVTGANGRDLPDVLSNVMYLWGVHLSEDERITAYEPIFLANALRSTAHSLTSTHPRAILHSLQAFVLLAYYFVRRARFLEGRYYTAAAVSISLGSGLHRIRTPPDATNAAEGSFGEVPPPRDAAEEGERIAAFWAVLHLNNCWAGTNGCLSNVTYGPSGPKIDTPWPLERRDYLERTTALPRHSTGTITKFLAGIPDQATSGPALQAKASILFEHATRFGAQSLASDQIDMAMYTLDARIEAFKAALPPIQSKAMVVIHTLAHVSTIQLHKTPMTGATFAGNQALSAARAVVDILVKTDIPNIGIIDPVLAVSPLYPF
ncbi:hypothetical protein DFH07DRAFT_730260 [Mycena maculata]|uniref:Zn(2)-C6 fungal-type domain-containing protein n=1 Tax=Mycena maculata TaxID=230809 RepID=A0AAD7K6M7_9AGAR|nr:hypothetical protein DFH07DRAFT_730260 [Mycena maculata]